MNVEHFENLVIGSGVAGKLLSWTLAGKGQKTVVVERAMVGGSCPNVACLPSKNVIHSAKALSLVDPKRGLGVVTGNIRVDMAAVARRKSKMVNVLVEVHLGKFKASLPDNNQGSGKVATIHRRDIERAKHLKGQSIVPIK